MLLRALRPRVRRSAVGAGVVFGVIGLPVLAAAQSPIDTSSARARFRDPNRNPANNQKLDESARKLQDEDLATRLEGLKGLGEVTDPKATELLIAASHDPETAVRVKAIDTLGQVKAKDATPVLLQQLVMRSTDTDTKRRILASLGKIGDPRATSTIVDLLARSDDPNVRGNAIFALGDLGDPAALPALERIVEKEPDLAALAQASIRRIRERPEPAAVPPALAGDQRNAAERRTP